MAASPQQFMAAKEAYYERVTRLVRWIGIAIVLATFPPSSSYYHILIFAAAMAIIFNGLRYTRLIHNRIFASRITTLICDNLLISILLLLSGGTTSPYFIFWTFTLISGSYWYGWRGALTVGFWQVAFSVFLALSHGYGPRVPTNGLSVALVRLGALVVIAFLAERLTHADRNERQVLADSNRQASLEQQRLRALINSLVDPVLTIDRAGKISIYNGAALNLLNTNQQLDNQDLNRFLHLHDANNQPIELSSLLGHENVQKRSDLLMKLNDGSSLNLDISISPVHSPEGEPSTYILILRDITKQKSLDQERDEFISVTSHELRTPVAIAEANLSTALMPGFDQIGPRAHELVHQAHQNIIFLGQLIADLSTLSKAEQGRLKIDSVTIDPAGLLHQLAEDYKASATAKKLQLNLKLDPELQPFQSSLNLLHEILQNFLTNAIKYTEKGTVTLSAKLGPAGHNTIFSVSDTGIGISAADQKKLFTKFYRSEDYRTRKTNGTGLGLYITVKLAERLHGKISFQSRLNRGSTFALEIPNRKATPATSPTVKSELANFVEGK